MYDQFIYLEFHNVTCAEGAAGAVGGDLFYNMGWKSKDCCSPLYIILSSAANFRLYTGAYND